MATIFDVAKYILTKRGETTTMKLQKLCYYAQAWQLTWCDEPMFGEEIQAWANGPVSPALYGEHRGWFTISADDLKRGDVDELNDDQRETIDIIIDHYGGKTGFELSELTHSEAPWSDTRGSLPLGVRCEKVITLASMSEYYQSL